MPVMGAAAVQRGSEWRRVRRECDRHVEDRNGGSNRGSEVSNKVFNALAGRGEFDMS